MILYETPLLVLSRLHVDNIKSTHQDCARILIENGTDVNARDKVFSLMGRAFMKFALWNINMELQINESHLEDSLILCSYMQIS